jgi:catechol 2,3-dioxygenase-like lactoylglutathione lyase family enzyme
MTGFAKLRNVVLECPDPAALADFYAKLTGWSVLSKEPDWVNLSDDGRIRLAFQLAPGYQPPVWPDDASPMQVHLDFTVDDLDEAGAQAVALGATKFAHQPGDDFVVYADPVGHPFCLCV